MKLVIPPLIIEESDSFKNDVLNRKAYGEALLNLVKSSSDELVISLDGRWGEGKTTFVKMWQGLLSESNIPNIYIDAFANDYLDDAFISVASAITAFVEENIEEDSGNKLSELKTKMKKMVWRLLTLATKAATLGAIKECDLEALKDIKDDIAEGTSSLLGNIIEERLASHSKDIALIKEFKELLSEIPAKLKGANGGPLIIIIDELDRCRPSFAIEMLEKIKHLFSVKNVVFILVMHKEQLEEAVKCIYGQKIDAHTYLQKFINLETKLPKQTTDQYANDLNRYSRKLFQLHEIETWGDGETILDCIELFAKHFNLSLRQLEKVYTNLALLYGSSAENYLRVVPIIVFLSIIKIIRPDVFDKLLHQKITYSEICKETGLNHFEGKHEELHWSINWVRYALLTDKEFSEIDDKDDLKGFENSLLKYFIKRKNLIPIFSKQLSLFAIK
ncbi:KAP P-loop domain protein [uncultured Gammaproteobacteria bacterium]|jgi:hypothetical protein|nr:KAP P-loop domain protein [uncultured Gammaproteobacteria bacterium]CAC9498491.1 KAP P-loop domain protein [uncultured Gammaproteobacteria bacterium]CAC9499389.1 KAP P-loop domain protein [uncultured Gammaproteobacteria bacterium]VVH51937.1 KAP P-loop domain protein [uncultured Gammaproteobacteria bacterium]